jgi:hypothetical protein
VSNSRRNLYSVLLDLHPAASAIAQLAAVQLKIDEGSVDRQARRQSLKHSSEALAMGFPSCDEAQHGVKKTLLYSLVKPQRRRVHRKYASADSVSLPFIRIAKVFDSQKLRTTPHPPLHLTYQSSDK